MDSKPLGPYIEYYNASSVQTRLRITSKLSKYYTTCEPDNTHNELHGPWQPCSLSRSVSLIVSGATWRSTYIATSLRCQARYSKMLQFIILHSKHINSIFMSWILVKSCENIEWTFVTTLDPCSFKQRSASGHAVATWGVFKRPYCQKLPPLVWDFESHRGETVCFHAPRVAVARSGIKTWRQSQQRKTFSKWVGFWMRPLLCAWLRAYRNAKRARRRPQQVVFGRGLGQCFQTCCGGESWLTVKSFRNWL